MNIKETAACLGELGNETRLEIFRTLVKSGHTKINVGDLQQQLNIPNSTLSHHLSKLTTVGLISQKKEGRQIFYHPNFPQLQGMIDFLLDECCEGETCLPKTSCC
ncbi:MAG: metalloregulator ArsR/SmtB family transcription factor [Lentisphaeraceae bacterium]|nr:metalloregulator ArsR/SmtB family transcription factor [Lentisphaeraceae bacterium]